MKKTILFIFIIFQVNLFSQDLESIVDQSKRWNILHTAANISGESPWEDYQSTFSIRIGGDVTVINNIDYYPVIFNGYVSASYNYRENLNNQVYFYSNTLNQEWLLYDFNVEIDDLVGLFNEYDGVFHDWTVINVSTEMYAGINRKKIELESMESSENEVWYEGIGSMRGLIYSGVEIIDNWTNHLCYFEDYDNFHQNYSGCNTSTYPMQDVTFFKENTFVLDHFLIDDTIIELPDGEYTAEFLSEQGNTNNVVEFNIGGMCGNSTSASVLVNTDSSLSILSRGGSTLTTCNPIEYPNGDNQEERFFNIISGFFMYPNPDEYLPVYYEKSNDNTQLIMWVYENEKLVFNVSERLGVANMELKNRFTIFPNPVKDKLTIHTDIKNYSVEVYTILGKQILNKNNMFDNSNIDMSDFDNGIYFFKISNGQSSFVTKIVKN